MNFNNLKLSNQICHRLYIATNSITRLYRPMLEKVDLTYPQYILMMALWEVREAPIQTLQGLTNIDSGSLTLILKKIEAKNYIKISIDDSDRRVKIVSLTKKGLDLRKKSHKIPENMLCKVNTLTKDDITELVRILDKLNEQICLSK